MTGQNSSGTGERSDERSRLAAIDRHARAGHKARLLGCQKDYNGCDLLGAAESAEWQLILDELGDLSRVLALTPIPRAAWKERRARRYAVDQDIVRGQFPGERLKEISLSSKDPLTRTRAKLLLQHYQHRNQPGFQTLDDRSIKQVLLDIEEEIKKMRKRK